MNFASAELFQFDNVKQYDKTTQTITIKNTFGLGGEIAKIKLNTPLINVVPMGYQKIAEFELNSFNEDYINALEKMEFYNINNKNSIIKNKQFDYKYKTIEKIPFTNYRTIWNNETGSKPYIESFTDYYEKEIWKDFNYYKILKGTYTIGIFTNVNEGDNVEWIPTFYGKELNEWATYIQSSGTEIIDGLYTIQTFTSNGTFNLTGDAYNVSILVVAGGAGGGGATENTGGGGGGGGIIYNNSAMLSAGNYNIIIGIGGLGVASSQGINGQNSSFGNNIFKMEAFGGGGGGSQAGTGLNGGSGGGGGGTVNFGTSLQNSINGTGYGFAGGQGSASGVGGGGGGAGEVGYNFVTAGATAGAGGIGKQFNINGTNTYFSGGGGGGNYYADTTGLGGSGGGGKGGQNADNGIVNTGGGGGGEGGSGTRTGGNGGSGIIIIRYLTPLNIMPKVTLNSPINYYNTTNPLIIFNSTITDVQKVTNVSLLIDGILNETDTSEVNGTYIFTKILSEGNHNWSILAYNNNSNSNQSITRFLNIDYTIPQINITSPLDNSVSYISLTTSNIVNASINWSVSDSNLEMCLLTNISSGLNITAVCNNLNRTFEVPFGSYTFRVYVNDSFGNQNSASATTTYKYKVFEINQSYNNPTIEYNSEDYYANIYIDSGLSITNVYFNYNGTNYSASYSEMGNYTRLKELDFEVPSVNANVNNTLTWFVLFNDSSRIQLTTKTQQANNFAFSVCGGSYPYKIFYLNLVDEKTQQGINGTIETNIQIKTRNQTNVLYNWTSLIVNTTSELCSSVPVYPTANYSVTGTIKYYSVTENYSASTEYYNFLNFSLNSLTQYQNVTLYDLNLTEATDFQLTFTDSAFRKRSDILIYVYRQYLPTGDFKVVELPKTDSNGQVVVHLVRNDVIYNFIAVDSAGNVLGVLNNVIAFCQDYTIGNCVINFKGISAETGLEDFLSDVGISYSLSYSNSTNLISLSFASSTNEAKDVRMEVVSSAIVTNRTLCNTSISAIAGTLTCDVSSIVNTTASVNVKIFVGGVQKIQDSLSFDNSSHNTGGLVFVGFLLLLTLGMIFIESKEGVVIATIFSFIAMVTFGIVKGSIIGVKNGVYASILWLIIVGVILLIKLNGERR